MTPASLRTLNDGGAFRGQRPQQGPGVLVSAVLRPHGAEHAEFREGGFPPHETEDLLPLLRTEPVLRHERGAHHRITRTGLHAFERGPRHDDTPPPPRSGRELRGFRRRSVALAASVALASPPAGDGREQRSEHADPVRVAEDGERVALRVRHEPQDVPLRVHDSGDVARRAVGVGGVRRPPAPVDVAEHDPVLRLELIERRSLRDELAFAVRDRDVDQVALGIGRRERRPGVLHPEPHIVTAEAEVPVADEGPRQQVRLAQHLESVADPEREPSGARKVDHLAHDRAEAGDRPRPQVVSVREPARQHDDVHALEVRRLVPQVGGALPQPLRHGPVHVRIAVRAREPHDSDLHPDLHPCLHPHRHPFTPLTPPARARRSLR